jgi:hypothetical protein
MTPENPDAMTCGKTAKKDTSASGVALPVSLYTQMPTAILLILLPMMENTCVTSKI